MTELRQPGMRRILDALKLVKQEAPALFDASDSFGEISAAMAHLANERAAERQLHSEPGQR
jgi:hypothetical protein